jgi:DNA repair photolyase
MGLKLLYVPNGRAREYVPEENGYAGNIWTGCDNGCLYCFAPGVLHIGKSTFYETPSAKDRVLERLEHDLKQIEGQGAVVFLCFTCDPFQPRVPEKENIIWRVLFLFLQYDVKIRILTKAGKYSTKMFSFYSTEDTKHLLEYGTTLVFANDKEAAVHEPHASPTSERIEALKEAYDLGIYTWVSLEPVWNPEDTLELIERVAPFSNMLKIGKLNHNVHAKYINWKKFGQDAERLCKKLKVPYYIKKDLREEMEK